MRMTQSELRTHVLEKIRTLVLNGSISYAVKWQYDATEPEAITKENQVLMSYMALGVIEVSALDPVAPLAFTKSEDGTLTWDSDTNIFADTMKSPYGEAVVDKLNAESYEQQCHIEGLEPYNETYAATMEVNGIGTPLVRVGRKRFVFNATKTDSYKELLLSYLKDKPGKLFSLADIKLVRGFSGIKNLNEAVENSYISQVLHPFVQVTKDSVVFNPAAKVTPEQLKEISLRSNPKKS